MGDLEAGMSSEAIGMDEAAIDAIPAESLPAGANRTEGPQPGASLATCCDFYSCFHMLCYLLRFL